MCFRLLRHSLNASSTVPISMDLPSNFLERPDRRENARTNTAGWMWVVFAHSPLPWMPGAYKHTKLHAEGHKRPHYFTLSHLLLSCFMSIPPLLSRCSIFCPLSLPPAFHGFGWHVQRGKCRKLKTLSSGHTTNVLITFMSMSRSIFSCWK